LLPSNAGTERTLAAGLLTIASVMSGYRNVALSERIINNLEAIWALAGHIDPYLVA